MANTSEKLRKYVMQSFGIDIKELEKTKLTFDEEILLCKIKEARNIANRMQGRKRKKNEDFEIDEELSKLCSKAWE